MVETEGHLFFFIWRMGTMGTIIHATTDSKKGRFLWDKTSHRDAWKSFVFSTRISADRARTLDIRSNTLTTVAVRN